MRVIGRLNIPAPIEVNGQQFVQFQDVLYRLCYCVSSHGKALLEPDTSVFHMRAAENEAALQINTMCDLADHVDRNYAKHADTFGVNKLEGGQAEVICSTAALVAALKL